MAQVTEKGIKDSKALFDSMTGSSLTSLYTSLKRDGIWLAIDDPFGCRNMSVFEVSRFIPLFEYYLDLYLEQKRGAFLVIQKEPLFSRRRWKRVLLFFRGLVPKR